MRPEASETTMVVGFPPGGSLDLTAQPLVESVNRNGLLPDRVVIVHRPGASGTIAMGEILSAKPDGRTLCLGAMGLLTLQPNLRDLPYTTAHDFTPIIGLVNNPVSLGVRADAPWANIAEFVAFARANPGEVRVGDLGKGSSLHLATEQMMLAAGLSLQPIHMSGSPECVTALLDGSVECITNHHAVFPDLVKEGRVRVLGVFEESRNSLFPKTETFKEAGFDLTYDSYACVIGPKGMESGMVSGLHDAFRLAMEDATFIRRMDELGLSPFYRNPDDLRTILLRDYEANRNTVRSVGIRI